MRINTSDKVIAYLTLFSGLAISGVAEYYSIMGLIAIYPAAFWPIVIMGVVLGFGKISATVWLKQNWEWSPIFLKAYVLPAIIVLMVITSLGVFGFLSKAHSDQSLVSGDVQSKIAVYDEKIKTAKENIDANRKALKQMDEAVDQSMARSNDEKGADKAVAIRRGQQKERQRLQSEIAAEQKAISQLSEERAPIAAEVRQVEAEVGPIKYIAHLLYGENPDANILEKAVIWVTVLIVIVLDPLAVILLLASQFSFQRFRQEEEEDTLRDEYDFSEATVGPVVLDVPDNLDKINQELDAEDVLEDLTDINFEAAEASVEHEPLIIEEVSADPHKVGWMYEGVPHATTVVTPLVADQVTWPEVVQETTDNEIIDSASLTEKEAMSRWKEENPDDSLKHQRRLLEIGKINKLPWETFLEEERANNLAAEEAAKWAAEHPETDEAKEAEQWADEVTSPNAPGLDASIERPGDYVTPPDEESKKKDNHVDGEAGEGSGKTQQGGLAGYVQNAEQSSITLWQRVKKAKDNE